MVERRKLKVVVVDNKFYQLGCHVHFIAALLLHYCMAASVLPPLIDPPSSGAKSALVGVIFVRLTREQQQIPSRHLNSLKKEQYFKQQALVKFLYRQHRIFRFYVKGLEEESLACSGLKSIIPG